MMIQGLTDARRILGSAVIGPEEVAAVLGADPMNELGAEDRARVSTLPFDTTALERARADGEMLVLRCATLAGTPLTLLALEACLHDALDPKVHRGVGYSLRDEWTIDSQPFAATETCATGWYLVRQRLLPATCNRLYRLQDSVLADLPDGSGRPRRRSAIEIAYDTLLWQRARGARLLADGWDWSRTPSSDHGFVAVGEFGDAGLGVIAYSRAVRFGSLGVCPQR
jgi:hypothetical protein